MNAHTLFPAGVDGADSAGKPAAATDFAHPITVRDIRFGRTRTPSRWWLGGDPVASAWFNALSATFPRGEAFFIDAVKAHRDGASPELAAEIKAFIAQEINHTREHVAFNRAAVDAGYDMRGIDARVADFIAMTKGRPEIVNLAATIALEHYTAMMAHQFLARPEHFAGAEPEVEAMWRWHAIEEIEHKGVAFDTYLHATRDWSRWKRWKLKSLMMTVVTINFIRNRFEDATELLAQDGLTGAKWRWKLISYLVFKPGILRKIFPSWVAYYLPGFHPWNHDDRALVARAEAQLRSA